jgi:hypothetical protein
MGTRAGIGFRYKEKDFLLYHHMDGGMKWLGLSILKFCRTHDCAFMRSRVEQLEPIDEDKAPTQNQICQWAAAYEWPQDKLDEVLKRLSHKNHEKRPTWDDVMTESVDLFDVMNGLNIWPDYTGFILSSHCEWAYVINLDTEKLEIYTSHYNAKHHEYFDYPKMKPQGRFADAVYDEESGKMERGSTLLDAIPLKDIREVPEFALDSFARRIDRQH